MRLAYSNLCHRLRANFAPTLTVTNLERSVSWYMQLLDLTILREYEPLDERRAGRVSH